MRNPSNLDLVAQSCLNCHTAPNEELVNKGGHNVGTLDFELVAWSQGKVRHNFVRSEGKTNDGSPMNGCESCLSWACCKIGNSVCVRRQLQPNENSSVSPVPFGQSAKTGIAGTAASVAGSTATTGDRCSDQRQTQIEQSRRICWKRPRS